METITHIAQQIWLMIAEMGSYLLLGFAISALLHQTLRQRWIERLMGRKGVSSIVWGSVVGVPMPLCSCGVIPVTMSLRDKGASKGASVSFLTSTPQTGVDSILATYAMLGPIFTAYKVVVAFLSGITIGLFTEWFTSKSETKKAAPAAASDEKRPPLPESLKYAFYTMPGDLANALLIGFLLAGLISALAPQDFLQALPGGVFTAILLSTFISVPLYICSTGSIPLALALVHSGLPISAALVLLIAGPATNVATINVMRRVLGGKTTFIYVAGVVLTTWIAAAIYHFAFGSATLGTQHMDHVMEIPLWKHLGGAALLLVLIWPKLYPLFSGSSHSHSHSHTFDHTMQTAHISVHGMNCSHCENSVKNGLATLAFQPTVISVDRNENSAIIQAERIDEAAIKEKVTSLGFDYQGCEIK